MAALCFSNLYLLRQTPPISREATKARYIRMTLLKDSLETSVNGLFHSMFCLLKTSGELSFPFLARAN